MVVVMGVHPAFTTRVDQTNGSTLVKLILFEKSRGIGIVFSIFTTRVRKHFSLVRSKLQLTSAQKKQQSAQTRSLREFLRPVTLSL